MGEEVEKLRIDLEVEKAKSYGRFLALRAAEAQVEALRAEVLRLRRGFAEIMAGCVAGTVGGDDVVWFSEIETLWEFCAGSLDPQGLVNWEVDCSDPDVILAGLTAKAEESAVYPDREELGRLIYLALYEPQGAVWAANESKDVWYDAADRLRASLGSSEQAGHRQPSREEIEGALKGTSLEHLTEADEDWFFDMDGKP